MKVYNNRLPTKELFPNSERLKYENNFFIKIIFSLASCSISSKKVRSEATIRDSEKIKDRVSIVDLLFLYKT